MGSKRKKLITVKPPPELIDPPEELAKILRTLPIYCNDGMGVESEAVFERWVNEPESRYFKLGKFKVKFDWPQVTMVSSQVGGEDPLTKYLMEQYKLPRYRDLNIRYVQVARAGPLLADGFVVLSDTRSPDTLYTEGGPFTLRDELLTTGTVPQYAGGKHLCSIHQKRDCVEPWVNFDLNEAKFCPLPRPDEQPGPGVPPVLRVYNYNSAEQTRIRESDAAILEQNLRACGVAFGYNADESRRIAESEAALAKLNAHYFGLVFGYNRDEQHRLTEAKTYDIAPRIGIYPLENWQWDRERCNAYIREQLGISWVRSRCTWCPFNSLTQQDLDRFRMYPTHLADALLIEYIALAMNPRATLYRNRSLYEVAVKHEMHEGLSLFDAEIKTRPYSLYRVRRIYNPKGKDTSKKGQTDRCVEKLESGTRDEMAVAFNKKSKGLLVESARGHVYAYVRHRAAEEIYPTAEEYFVACPNTVATKARYGVEWFDDKWYRTVGWDPTRASAGQLGLSF